MKYIKTYEYAFRNGTTPVVNIKEIYVIFDNNKGYTLDKNLARKQKIQLLDMFKEYYNIDKSTERYAMTDQAWAWNLRFHNSFGENLVSISDVTSNGWSISTNAIVIEAKEFLIVGLEELDTYISAKNYNL